MKVGKVFVLFLQSGLETNPEFLGAFSSYEAAEMGIDRYRDERYHPPDLDDFTIEEKPVLDEGG